MWCNVKSNLNHFFTFTFNLFIKYFKLNELRRQKTFYYKLIDEI